MSARAAPSPRARRRRGASARRRVLVLIGVAGLVAAAVAVVAPMLHRAVREVTLPLRHEDIIRQQAREKRLDPALVAGVIFAESKFRDQTSATGAKGLMQIQPETAKFIARRSGGAAFEIADLGTPQINIQYGTYHLRELLDLYVRQHSKHGIGAALLQARRCGACRIELDRGEISRIANTPADAVVRCPECGAILVRTKESGL